MENKAKLIHYHNSIKGITREIKVQTEKEIKPIRFIEILSMIY